MIDRRTKARFFIFLLLLFLGFGEFPLQAANAPDDGLLGAFKGVDIRDRPVTDSVLRGKTLIISISDQETADAAIEWQTQIGVEAELGPGRDDDLLHLAIADVSSYPRIVKPIVRRRLNGIYERLHQRLLQRFTEKNHSPPADMKARVYFVPDWTGTLVQILLGDVQKQLPQLIVIDRDGTLVGRFNENKGTSNQQLLALIEKLLVHSELQGE